MLVTYTTQTYLTMLKAYIVQGASEKCYQNTRKISVSRCMIQCVYYMQQVTISSQLLNIHVMYEFISVKEMLRLNFG